jgi:hypothetical protein
VDVSEATFTNIAPADKGKLYVTSVTGTFDNANVGEDRTVTFSSVVLGSNDAVMK